MVVLEAPARMDRKRLMVWLAFVSVLMSAAIANIVNFANRPSSPVCWIDTRADKATELSAKLDGEAEADRRKDMERYLWLLLESRQRKEAHDTAAALLPMRPNASGYDIDYVNRLQRLACAELMHDSSQDMLVTLQHLYDYDALHLSPKDIRLFRDCNNFGLACFLVGQSSDDGADRQTLLMQSDEWLRKAESGIPASAKSDLLSVKENQLMLAEAMNNRVDANSCREQIDMLLAEIDGPSPRVRLD
jgi:hypothetical protein